MNNIFFEADGSLKLDPKIPDNFSLFGFHKSYKIDLQKLENAFEEYIFQLHPDFFSTSSQLQKTLSLKFSSVIKQAKDELADPFARAIYLCKLCKRAPQELDLQQPQNFLIETLEIREKLENSDALKTQKNLISKIQKEYSNLLEQLTVDFEYFIDSQNKEDLFATLSQRIGKIKYYKNIELQITSLK